jgi:hypothetical protein
MRGLVCLLVWVTACEPALPPARLPELVTPPRPRAITELAPWVIGETLRWEVRAGGLAIGRLELEVGATSVRSHFATNRLASAFARVVHELTTWFDAAGRPQHARDDLELDGARGEIVAVLRGARVEIADRTLEVPGGNRGHTLHSALAAIRAWAGQASAGAFLYVVHSGELFRLDLDRPLVEAHGLRIGARVREADLGLTIWLRGRDHVPLRIEVRGDGVRATAELIDD